MHHTSRNQAARIAVSAALLAGFAAIAEADVITDWNTKAGEFVVEAKLGTPPAMRLMAIVQTAVHDAVRAIAGHYPTPTSRAMQAPGSSVDAAVAAANRVTLARLLPSQQAAIETAYRAALAQIADGPARAAGVTAGEQGGSRGARAARR